MANVMIVDDTIFMRSLLRTILTEAGFNVVVEAGNGVEAIKQYRHHRPDLVTMDITMPDMEGIDAVKEIIKFDPKAKIIMCSAMGQHRMVLQAIGAGAKDFIVKPFEKDRVVEAVINQLHQPKI